MMQKCTSNVRASDGQDSSGGVADRACGHAAMAAASQRRADIDVMFVADRESQGDLSLKQAAVGELKMPKQRLFRQYSRPFHVSIVQNISVMMLELSFYRFGLFDRAFDTRHLVFQSKKIMQQMFAKGRANDIRTYRRFLAVQWLCSSIRSRHPRIVERSIFVADIQFKKDGVDIGRSRCMGTRIRVCTMRSVFGLKW